MAGAIRTGIYAYFTTNNTSALYIALSGRLYYGEMPEKPTYPYCVFHVFDETPERTFDIDFEDVFVQFDYYDVTAGGCDTGLSNIKTLYDYASLTIAGYTSLRMERSLVVPSWKVEPDDCWAGIVRYDLLIQKT